MELFYDSMKEAIEDVAENKTIVSDNQQIQEDNAAVTKESMSTEETQSEIVHCQEQLNANGPITDNELIIDSEDLKKLEKIGKDADEAKPNEQPTLGKGWCMPSVCGGGSTGSWCMPRTTI